MMKEVQKSLFFDLRGDIFFWIERKQSVPGARRIRIFRTGVYMQYMEFAF
jgi:hypothetical protein